jgi:transketolase
MNANETASLAPTVPTYDCRQIFVETLIELARENPRIVAVCNDSVGSSNLGAFAKAFPDRLINVGIAEQNMVGVAAGLANGGFIPFVCAAGPFLSGRATEQIKADIAYSNFPAILCAMSPGLAYGELGPTHHSIEDFAWMRAISDLVVMAPADPKQTRDAMRWAAQAGKPAYMRVARFKIPAVTPDDQDFVMGRANVLRSGNDVTLIAIGTMVSRALDAAAELEKDGIRARVLNMATLKPLDEESVLAAARETGRIVTAEEGIIFGGLGSAVAEVTAQRCPVPVRILGVPGFAPTGSTEFLLEHFGLTSRGIAAAARDLLGKSAN